MNCKHSATLLAVLAVSMAAVIHGAVQLEEDTYYGTKLSIRVVDQNGRPVEGAIAGFSAIRWSDGTWKVACNPDVTRTNAEGIVELPKGMKLLGYDDRSLVALHEDRKLMGVVRAKQTHPDEHGVVTIPITSALRRYLTFAV